MTTYLTIDVSEAPWWLIATTRGILVRRSGKPLSLSKRLALRYNRWRTRGKFNPPLTSFSTFGGEPPPQVKANDEFNALEIIIGSRMPPDAQRDMTWHVEMYDPKLPPREMTDDWQTKAWWLRYYYPYSFMNVPPDTLTRCQRAALLFCFWRHDMERRLHRWVCRLRS